MKKDIEILYDILLRIAASAVAIAFWAWLLWQGIAFISEHISIH